MVKINMTDLEIYRKTRYKLVEIFLEYIHKSEKINTDYIDEIFKETEENYENN